MLKYTFNFQNKRPLTVIEIYQDTLKGLFFPKQNRMSDFQNKSPYTFTDIYHDTSKIKALG